MINDPSHTGLLPFNSRQTAEKGYKFLILIFLKTQKSCVFQQKQQPQHHQTPVPAFKLSIFSPLPQTTMTENFPYIYIHIREHDSQTYP